MLDIKKISRMAVSDEVEKFMVSNGGNHATLYASWKDNEAMHTDHDLLEQQLAFAIRNKRKSVASRILSRIRKVDSVAENAALEHFLNPKEDKTIQPLGCLA